jgi:hypothetical protein
MLYTDVMKRKFKEWWLTIPPISTKRTTTFHLKSLNRKKDKDIVLEIQVLA